ncbi:hypothetical protein TRIUR3_27274 [Triticum urartu]|uniref:Uncharacterized protein n=1 Tax=Triticum urartu TaxID=4572 RepID=M7YPJ5_TRIUA|nr:hypothetical protein TRIUR3_27274 [Triticum urartu]
MAATYQITPHFWNKLHHLNNLRAAKLQQRGGRCRQGVLGGGVSTVLLFLEEAGIAGYELVLLDAAALKQRASSGLILPV